LSLAERTEDKESIVLFANAEKNVGEKGYLSGKTPSSFVESLIYNAPAHFGDVERKENEGGNHREDC
jgi:hypothetical protein